ncbi:MAG: hypothetical protein HC785_16480 [Calothrix sp. CSU_2_0]|nr:hypothetical protein [Calothrix sp. CSU_2_0]
MDEILEVPILKQRDDGATLIKVYVSPSEHEQLKILCSDKGGMSHVLRMLAVKWLIDQNAIAPDDRSKNH